MKKLGTRVNLWIFLIFWVVIFDTALDLYTLTEIRNTDKILTQVYEGASRVRKLREFFFQYHNYAMIAAVSRERRDLKLRDQARRKIMETLKDGPDTLGNPEFARDFALARSEVEALMALQPKEGEVRPIGRSLLLSREYRLQYSDAFEEIERISKHTGDLIEQEEKRDEEFYHKSLFLNLIFLASSISLLAIILIFFRKKIIVPILGLIEMAKKIKKGDLTARVEIQDSGELAEMGAVLNSATQELRLKREERIKFIASVAHDIKNPLTAIGMGCDIVLRQSENSDAAKPYLKIFTRMKSQVERIRLMSDDLLEAAKDGMPAWNLTPAMVKLDEVLLEVIDMFLVNSTRKIQLIQESHVEPFHGDPNRIIQVATNLISNALKYSPADKPVEVAYGTLKGQTYFEVRDCGLGIPEDKRRAIFEPFTRLEEGKRFSAGTGLGLSIVKEIVDAHQGEIAVYPRSTGGTVFHVEFPQSQTS